MKIKKLLFLIFLFVSVLNLQKKVVFGADRMDVGRQESVDCFSLYKFQKIDISFSPVGKSEAEVLPGEKLILIGEVVNKTPVAVPEGQIKYRLVRINPDENKRKTEGDQIYDKGLLVDKVNLSTGEVKGVEAEYQMPKVLSGGKYRLNFYFTQNNQFNWSGLYFTDDIIGGFLPITVKGREQLLPYFDRGKTEVNGKHHNHIGYISNPLEKGKSVIIKNTIVNPAEGSVSGKIISKLYYWDQQEERHLLHSEEKKVSLSAGENIPLEYNIDKAEKSVYTLELEFRMERSSYRTIIFTRIGTKAVQGRINSLGLSKFPVKRGEQSTFYVCYHNTSNGVFKGKISAQLQDEKGDVLTDLSFKGEIPSDIQAVKKDITWGFKPNILVLSAKILDEKGKIVDEGKLEYNCRNFKGDSCLVDRSGFSNGDQAGNLLDKKIGDFFSNLQRKSQGSSVLALKSNVMKWIVGAITLLLIVILIFIFWSRRKPPISVIFLLFFGVFVLFPKVSFAAETGWNASKRFSENGSITIHDPRYDSWRRFYRGSYTVTVDYVASSSVEEKSNICPGDEIDFSFSKEGTINANGGYHDSPYVSWVILPLQEFDRQGCHTSMYSHKTTCRQIYYIGASVSPEPVLNIESDKNDIVACQGYKCTAVNNGTANLEVKVPESQLSVAFQVEADGETLGPNYGRHHIDELNMGTLKVDVGGTSCEANSPPIASCSEVENIDVNSAELTWSYTDPENDPQAFWEVQVSDQEDFSTLSYNQSGDDDSSSVTATGLTPNTKYYWRVKVKDVKGAESDWSSGDTCSFTSGQPQCGSPCEPGSDNPDQCPEQCPICVSDPDNPDTGICSGCGVPCGSPTQCPEQCPICAETPEGESTCQELVPTPTPTAGPQCGETCDPRIPNVCEQEDCLVCGIPPDSPASQPICMSCNCDGMEIDGEVKEGGTVTVTAWGKVANPETNAAEVKNIVFKVYKGSREDPPFTRSDPITVTDPISDTDEDTGEPIYRYSASWSYTVPEADEYWIKADISCGRESSEIAASLPEGRGEENSFFGGILDTVSNFFRNLFGLGGEESVVKQNQGDIPQVTVVAPTGSSTLQLGTFSPDELTPSPTPLVEEACHDVHFIIY